jgi:hypothetical protein
MTEAYARAGAGYRGPVTYLQQSIQRLRIPFSNERDVERAVTNNDLILELQR